MIKEGKMDKHKQTINKNKVSDVLTDFLAPPVSFFIFVPLGSVSPSFSVSPTGSPFHTHSLSLLFAQALCALQLFFLSLSLILSRISLNLLFSPISLCHFLKQIYIMAKWWCNLTLQSLLRQS